MKNNFLFITLFMLFTLSSTSKEQRFHLWDITGTCADASVLLVAGCPQPLPYKGYVPSISNDIFYIKPLVSHAELDSASCEIAGDAGSGSGTTGADGQSS